MTCCSCMHSSRAACVFGEARLISSTSRRLANTGPGLNSNSFERWSKTFTPVTSEGSRSGVNCMREKETSSDRASALASIVLPTPGKSSRIRCPSPTRQRTAETERLLRRVDDSREVVDECRGSSPRQPPSLLVRYLARSRNSSSAVSTIAAAIRSFGALSTRRSPAALTSTTSFSSASKPTSSRDTSL